MTRREFQFLGGLIGRESEKVAPRLASANLRSRYLSVVVTRCRAALPSTTGYPHAHVRDRLQCTKPAMKGLVVCREHHRKGGTSAFSTGAFVPGGTLKRTRRRR